MITSSLRSTARLTDENSSLMERVSYSRHLPMQRGQGSMKKKPSKIIHVTIRSPKNIRRLAENKLAQNPTDLRSVPSNLTSTNYQNHVSNSDTKPCTTNHVQSATQSSAISEPVQPHRSLSQMTAKSNSYAIENDNEIKNGKNDRFSNTRDLIENTKKRRKKGFPKSLIRQCAYTLVFLTIALILLGSIAGVLAATLIKFDTTSTLSTTQAVLTTINMNSTITTSPSLVTTTPSTTTTTITPLIMTTASLATTIASSIMTTTTSAVTTTTITPSTTIITTARGTNMTTSTTTSIVTTTIQYMAGASPSSSVVGYSGTESVKINCSTTLTNITLQIFVRRMYGATYNTMYGNYWSGTVTTSQTTNSTHIIYTWTIVNGQTITCSGGPYTFTAQFNLNGTAQVTSGDTYIVTTRTNTGVVNILSGQF